MPGPRVQWVYYRKSIVLLLSINLLLPIKKKWFWRCSVSFVKAWLENQQQPNSTKLERTITTMGKIYKRTFFNARAEELKSYVPFPPINKIQGSKTQSSSYNNHNDGDGIKQNPSSSTSFFFSSIQMKKHNS